MTAVLCKSSRATMMTMKEATWNIGCHVVKYIVSWCRSRQIRCVWEGVLQASFMHRNMLLWPALLVMRMFAQQCACVSRPLSSSSEETGDDVVDSVTMASAKNAALHCSLRIDTPGVNRGVCANSISLSITSHSVLRWKQNVLHLTDRIGLQNRRPCGLMVMSCKQLVSDHTCRHAHARQLETF